MPVLPEPFQPQKGWAPGRAPVVAPAAIPVDARLGRGAFVYEPVADWCRLPDERPLGNIFTEEHNYFVEGVIGSPTG